jgi:phage tail sheath gpL-like
MGQKLAAGSEAELTLKTVSSEEEAITLYGQGSMVHRMVKYYKGNNKVTELKVMSIDDDVAGVQATAKLTISGPATADGTLAVYIAGQKVSIAVAKDDIADDMATALQAAIAAEGDLPCTAVVNGVNANEVDLTAKHKGLIGNELDVRVNYFSSDAYPAGVSIAITAFAGGTGSPDVAEIIAALPDDQFNVIINPWTDAANLTALETELADRFGPIRQSDGVAIAYKLDTLSNLQSLGNGRNSGHSSISGPCKSAPNPSYEWSAAKAGQIALSAQADPARPFQTLKLEGILAPRADEQFTLTERDVLLSDGIATDKVNAAGEVRIERAITTYQLNTAGAPSDAFLDLTTMFTLSYLRYDFRTQMLSKFPRHKLANDGVKTGAGQAILTPLIAKAEAVRIFQGWEELGLVEDLEQFKRDIIVERNAQDVSRLDFLLPPNLVNSLRVIGSQIQFLL